MPADRADRRSGSRGEQLARSWAGAVFYPILWADDWLTHAAALLWLLARFGGSLTLNNVARTGWQPPCYQCRRAFCLERGSRRLDRAGHRLIPGGQSPICDWGLRRIWRI